MREENEPKRKLIHTRGFSMAGRMALVLAVLGLAVPVVSVALEQSASAKTPPPVAPAPDPPSICDAILGNLVMNCGFEAGNFSHWVQSGNTGSTGVNGANVNSGAFSAFLGPVGSDGILSQALAGITPSTTYTLSFYYFANGSGPSDFGAQVSGVLVGSSVGTESFLSQCSPTYTGDVWERFSFNFQTPSTPTMVALSFNFRNDPSYDYLDDISVVADTGTPPAQVIPTLCIVPAGAVPPDAPSGLTASDGPVTLNWQAPISQGTSPVVSYEVFRFTASTAATQIAKVSAPTTTYVDSSVTPGVTYSYYVEAVNQFGTSPPSNVVSITPNSSPAPAPPGSACSGATGNTAFVCGLYQDILGRSADSSGLGYWLTQLSAGASPTQVAYAIATSNEYRTDFIQADYQAFLGRSPDPGGLATWLAAFASGATDEQVDAGILGSSEFFSDSGGTGSGFINAVYQDLLGRPADPGGMSTWSAALGSGMSRTQVAYAIDTSNEARSDTVQFFYQLLLNRPADPGGLSTWAGALNSGSTDEQVLAAIAGSPEFYSDASNAYSNG